MAQTGTGTGGYTNAIQVYYVRRLLSTLRKRLKLDQWALQTKLPKNEGNEVKWRRNDLFGAITTPLTEGTSPTPQTLQSTAITATPLQYGAVVEVTDLLIDESIDPVVESAVDVLAYQGALSMDTLIRNTIEGNLTDQFAAGKATVDLILQADVYNAAEVRKAVTALKVLDVMPFGNGDYAACIHPAQGLDLMADSDSNGWLELIKYTDPSNAMKGELGKIYGARFAESSNINVAANTQPVNVYHSFLFGMEAYGIVELSSQSMKVIRKQLGSAGTADPLDQRATVGWKFSHVTKVLDANRAIEVQTASSFGA